MSMFRHYEVWAFCLVILFFASIACLFLRCQRGTPPPPPSDSLKLQIIYHEKHFLQGMNVKAVDGMEEFIFQNTSTTKPLTIKRPPIEVFMLTSNSKRRLEESDWPEFARRSASFTLPPGGQRVFASAFCMDVVKSPGRRGRIGPDLCFVFGPLGTGSEKEEEVFAGSVVSESSWDDSRTSDLKMPNESGEAGGSRD
jgi:hypothetical protein